jgi:putative acetyltransferase
MVNSGISPLRRATSDCSAAPSRYAQAMPDLEIRSESPQDAAEVADLVAAAFADQGQDTARFVADVRQKAQIVLAEVVVADGAIVGHAQWCAAPIRVDGFPIPAAYLACLSVSPDRHRQGIGARLVESGLAALRADGFQAVTLLGSPDYYGRFGFSSTLAQRIRGLHRQKGVGFQAKELEKGALAGVTVISDYPAVITPG